MANSLTYEEKRELYLRKVEEKITTLQIIAMADTMQYFIEDIKRSNGGIVVGKKMEYAIERMNHFANSLVLELTKRHGEEVVDDFAHDADLMRQVMRIFMQDLIDGIMKRYDREDNQ